MRMARLEAVDLDSLAIKTQAFLLIGQEILHIFALVSLQLDHLSHLRVGDDGAIAGELLLDHLEDLFLVEFLGQALDRGQGFATIALCEGLTSAAHDRRAVDTTRSEGATAKCHTTENKGILTLNANVNVVLLTSLCLSTSVIGLRKGIEGLEVLNVRGHMIG
jgi:hypothetical protein